MLAPTPDMTIALGKLSHGTLLSLNPYNFRFDRLVQGHLVYLQYNNARNGYVIA